MDYENPSHFSKRKGRDHQNIEHIDDAVLLHAIKNLIEFARKKEAENYLGETIEEYNLAIEQADAEIESGKFVEHEEVMKRIGEWRNKAK